MNILHQNSILAALLLSIFGVASAVASEPAKVLAALSLPNDPKILTDFEPVYESARPVQTEAEAETNMSAVRKFEVKHVGGRRLLFRIEFDQIPYKGESARYNLYLDTDNNTQTGRPSQETPGIDFMANITKTDQHLSFYNPELTANNTAFRSVFDGKILYITLESPLPPAGERIPLAGWILSQRNTPPMSNSSNVKARFSVPRGKLEVAPLTQNAQATVL